MAIKILQQIPRMVHKFVDILVVYAQNENKSHGFKFSEELKSILLFLD